MTTASRKILQTKTPKVVTAAIVKLHGSLVLILQFFNMVLPVLAAEAETAGPFLLTDSSPLILEPNLYSVFLNSESLCKFLPGKKTRIMGTTGKEKL